MFSHKPMSFIDRLRRAIAADPRIQDKLRSNEPNRLFDDLPDSFDAILTSTQTDTNDLILILQDIKANNTELAENGMQFTREMDREKITAWAKTIIAQACNELLDADNTIQPELLKLIQPTKDAITNRDLICAYFGTLTLYIISQLRHSHDAGKISKNVYDAFIASVNQYPKWVQEVLKDRILGPVTSYEQPKQDNAIISTKQLLTAGSIALGLFGAILGAGLLVHQALSEYDSDNENSSDSEDEFKRQYKRGN